MSYLKLPQINKSKLKSPVTCHLLHVRGGDDLNFLMNKGF